MLSLRRGAALVALALLAGPLSAQPITGRVVDAATDMPLPGVTLLADGTTAGTTTDADGRFALEADGAETVTASFVGYQTETVAARPDLTIRLRAATTDLQPVVVAASRTARARAEVPVALATISAADLQATRPNLLSEALNRTAGVYMVDLGNEQHAMAIRQPFSYKPLFLYLEDGVPIRPAGLFNHNALIEVNQGGVEQIEIVRGPGSALYGAGAIGGAVNFVTQTPSAADRVATSARGGSYGYGRFDGSGAGRSGRVGFFAAGYVAGQRDGLREHSDYDKVSVTGRADVDLGPTSRLTLTGTYNDLGTDTDGSLDSLNFFSDGFTSLQTFTNRDVQAGRGAVRLDHQWAGGQRTSVTAFGRVNSVAQNPHYRLRIDRADASRATGEVNDNAFTSLGLQAQHEAALGPVRLLAGGTLDRSPASYVATRTEVTRDAETGVFTSFTDTGELLTDYQVVLGTVAGYVQAEVEPLSGLRVVGSVRADRVQYDFDNNLPPGSFSGVVDTTNAYSRVTPRLGVVWSPSAGRGVYANASQGFLPPEAGELYRGTQVPTLRPAVFDSYEVGGFARFWDSKIALDVSLYRMDGRDEIVTVRTADGDRVDRNAGQTLHQGIEYAVVVQPNAVWSARLSATNARHEFVEFTVDEREGRETSFDGNRQDRAPEFIANGEVAVRPAEVPGLRLAAEVQRVSGYWMDPENTVRYDGHAVVNLRAQYAEPSLRGLEVWEP